MAFNDRMLKGLLKMVPQSVIDGVPELIVNAINAKLASVEHQDYENVAAMIIPGSTDCRLNIIVINPDDTVKLAESYSGKEFINKLIKETANE